MQLFPVTAILGARQCGKTTISRLFNADYSFDLENPRDLAKLEQPQLALEDLEGLVVIDEIQRKPELFPLLRFLVDNNKKIKFLILGSASRELINKSSESLAGRIGYFYLEGFSLQDIETSNWKKLWLRGGYPLSYLATDDEASTMWRENYITTYLEKDIPLLGINIPSATLRRFWIMLSHYHGQTMNYSELGRSFGISDMTVRKYIDILEATFMIRTLLPWFTNTGKRLVKSPKIYLRDSGIFHTLQSIDTHANLQSNRMLGASWEGFALDLFIRIIGKKSNEVFFWSTHSGAEVDLFWQQGGKNYAAEFKFADAPKTTKSMRVAIEDLELEQLFVIYPGKENYKADKTIAMIGLSNLSREELY